MKRQNIQILRSAACLGVFIVHLGQRLEPCAAVRFFTDCGAMGVYLFFLISGYVSFLSFEKTNGNIRILKYYIVRFARILPVYYAVIFYQFLLHTYILCDVPFDKTEIGWKRYIFCISRVIPADEPFWTNLNSTWTIGAFVCFYLTAPYLYRNIWNYNTALIGWMVSYCFSFYLNYYVPEYFEPVKQLPYFLLGIVIYYIEKEKNTKQVIGFCLINLLFIIVMTGEWKNDIWAMFFGALILCSRNLHITDVFVCRCINSLEKYAYSMYLVHVAVMEYVDRWKLSHVKNWRIQAIMIIIAGSITGTFFVYNLIEKPVYYFARKYTKEEKGVIIRQINKNII